MCKTVSNERLKSYQMIHRCSSPAASVLYAGQQVVRFQIILQSSIDYSLHCIGQTTCKRNRPIVVCLAMVLAGFWECNYCCGSPLIGKVSFISKYIVDFQ